MEKPHLSQQSISGAQKHSREKLSKWRRRNCEDRRGWKTVNERVRLSRRRQAARTSLVSVVSADEVMGVFTGGWGKHTG